MKTLTDVMKALNWAGKPAQKPKPKEAYFKGIPAPQINKIIVKTY